LLPSVTKRQGRLALSKPSPLSGALGAFSAGVLVGLGVALGEQLRRAAPRARRLDDSDSPPSGDASPAHAPARDWLGVLAASWRDFNRDRIPATAAGVTFFVLLALFPALSAFVSLYGLAADAGDVRRQVLALSGLLPGGAIEVLNTELTRLISAGHGSLGVAFVVSLAVSIWSATAGMKALIDGLNVAYETRERRGFIRLNLVALVFTFGGVAVAIASVTLLVGAPSLLARAGVANAQVLALLRWPILLSIGAVLISVLYRFAPFRPGAKWRWITPGGALAAVGWMLMSALFTWYVANFGHYDKTYGSLGAIVGFLTWVWLSLMVLLFGAELNSEAEKARPETS